VKHSFGVFPSTTPAIWIHLSLVATDAGIDFIPFSIYPYYSLVQAFRSAAATGAAAFFSGAAAFFFLSSNYYCFSSAASFFALTYANFL